MQHASYDRPEPMCIASQKLKTYYTSIASRSSASLNYYLGNHEVSSVDTNASANDDWLQDLLEKVLELGIRPVRFKVSTTSVGLQ